MISLRQDALLLSLKPFDALRLIPEARDKATWSSVERNWAGQVTVRAAQALAYVPPAAQASDYLRFLREGSGPWLEAWTGARERLKALALGACVQGSPALIQGVADQLYALCEISDWALRQPQPDYPDFTHGCVDVDACETGALLAVTAKLLGEELDALSPRIAARVRRALDRRLMEPLINHDPQVWLLAPEDAPRAAAALMTVALLMERDDRRRWLALRRILKLLEGYLKDRPADGGFDGGLEAHLTQAMAVNDCFSMLSVASGGEVELRDEPLFVAMAGSFVSCHIAGNLFLNPGGSMAPRLSPDLLFRLGESARVSALCGLAAWLRRGLQDEAAPPFSQPTEPLLQQVMNALGRDDLMKQAARSPVPEWVELPQSGLLAGRMDGFYAALTGPAGQAAGDIVLFYGDRPLIIGLSQAPSTPLVNGQDQRSSPGAQDVAHSGGPGWHMLSMNLACAYPPAAQLVSWQRTWMLAPSEGGLRLMDVFDLDAPGQVAFRFITPSMPRVQSGGALLAEDRVWMEFDPGLAAQVDWVTVPPNQRHLWGERVFRLTLTTPQALPGGNYDFLFRPWAGGV